MTSESTPPHPSTLHKTHVQGDKYNSYVEAINQQDTVMHDRCHNTTVGGTPEQRPPQPVKQTPKTRRALPVKKTGHSQRAHDSHEAKEAPAHPTLMSQTQMTVLTCNTMGLTQCTEDLAELAIHYHPDVMVLTETKLTTARQHRISYIRRALKDYHLTCGSQPGFNPQYRE